MNLSDDVYSQLNDIIKNWCHSLENNKIGLVGVLQFGSTLKKPIKKETDLDILLIFDELPSNKYDQFKLTLNMEDQLNSDLKKIKNHNIQCSFILKKVSQLDHLSPFYLDFIDTSRIWLDPYNHLGNLIADIKNWIEKNGSKKIKKGNLWYWIYSPDHTIPVNFKFERKSGDEK